jgi:hypothetical protein
MPNQLLERSDRQQRAPFQQRALDALWVIIPRHPSVDVIYGDLAQGWIVA